MKSGGVVLLSLIALSGFLTYIYLPVLQMEINNYLIKTGLIKSVKSIPFVATYPYSINMAPLNVTLFQLDINLAKSIGFKGIKLGNIECYYADGRLLGAVQNITRIGLKVWVPIRWFNGLDYSFPYPSEAYSEAQTEKFPDNTTLLNWFLEWVENVTVLLKDDSVDKYVFYYPFNWNDFPRWKTKAETEAYKNAIQQVIDAIYNANPDANIYLASELMEKEGVNLPTDIAYVKGFGFQPYSFDTQSIDKPLINRLYSYWLKTGKDVYIDEWGWRITGVYSHGKTLNEAWKTKLIRQMVEYLYGWNIKWCYFGLYDFPPENADWGIAYYNGTLKPSGIAMKEALNRGA